MILRLKERWQSKMENYFWNTEEQQSTKKIFVLIIYDIVNNKRRNKFAKLLNGYGMRIQKSSFEALVDKKLLEKLEKEIPKLIDSDEDSVRIYRMTGYGEVILFGQNQKLKNEEVVIL